MKIIAWIIAGIALVALPVSCERRAESKAKLFCQNVKIGSALSNVIEESKASGARILNADDGSVYVIFVGIPPFSRHTCRVQAGIGKVSGKEYFHLD